MGKKSKTKVSRRIAGVNVPKAMRRRLRGLAKSQTGRTLFAEALAVAGAALAASQARPGSPARRAVAYSA